MLQCISPLDKASGGAIQLDLITVMSVKDQGAAPGAYKDVSAVVAAAEQACLARRVARLKPLICIKG
jgi:tRNA-splicing ligase RtcB